MHTQMEGKFELFDALPVVLQALIWALAGQPPIGESRALRSLLREDPVTVRMYREAIRTIPESSMTWRNMLRLALCLDDPTFVDLDALSPGARFVVFFHAIAHGRVRVVRAMASMRVDMLHRATLFARSPAVRLSTHSVYMDNIVAHAIRHEQLGSIVALIDHRSYLTTTMLDEAARCGMMSLFVHFDLTHRSLARVRGHRTADIVFYYAAESGNTELCRWLRPDDIILSDEIAFTYHAARQGQYHLILSDEFVPTYRGRSNRFLYELANRVHDLPKETIDAVLQKFYDWEIPDVASARDYFVAAYRFLEIGYTTTAHDILYQTAEIIDEPFAEFARWTPDEPIRPLCREAREFLYQFAPEQMSRLKPFTQPSPPAPREPDAYLLP